MKSTLVLVVAVVSAAAFTSCEKKEDPVAQAAAPGAAKTEWLRSFERAKAEARAENRMLLILFTGSDWCPPCMMLEREVFKQPEFTTYAAQHLVLLEIDFPRIKMQSLEEKAANRKLAEQFGIYGFPTVVVLNSGGEEIGRFGYQPGGPKPYLAALEKLRGADGTNTPE